jgi:type IV secretory pathway TraG/TraD family ATPase VirD4
MNFLNRLFNPPEPELAQPEPIPAPGSVIRWGNFLLPNTEATNHFGIVGTTGSGKTTLLRLTMQSALEDFGTRDCRAIVFDAKQDMFPILAGIVDPRFIISLNPFDQRGAAWDLANDLNEPRVIHEFVSILIPEQHDANPFFSSASRHLTYGVMLSYYLRRIPYTLADVFRPMTNLRQLKQTLRQHPVTAHFAGMYLSDTRLAKNVLSSLATKIQPYEPIAAAWQHAQQKVSLRDWLNKPAILLLGNSEVSRHSIDAINRCIFKRASSLTLNLNDSPSRRIWFVLDELSDAGKLDGLIPLAKKGRSKGACLLLAFQSISGLRNERLYGTHDTDELMGQLGNRFVGRLECVATADYFSQLIGEQERIEISHTYSSSWDSKNSSSTSSTSSTHTPQIRKAVLSSEFLDLPPCSLQNGLTGFGITRLAGCYRTHLPGDELFNLDLLPPNPLVPAQLDREPDSQILNVWSPEECVQFGVTHGSSQARAATKPKPAPSQTISSDPLKGMFDEP